MLSTYRPQPPAPKTKKHQRALSTPPSNTSPSLSCAKIWIPSIFLLPLTIALLSCGPKSEKPSFSFLMVEQTAAYHDLGTTLELIDKEGEKDHYLSRLESEIQTIMALKGKLSTLPQPTAEEMDTFQTTPAYHTYFEKINRVNTLHLHLKANHKSSPRIDQAMSLLNQPL